MQVEDMHKINQAGWEKSPTVVMSREDSRKFISDHEQASVTLTKLVNSGRIRKSTRSLGLEFRHGDVFRRRYIPSDKRLQLGVEMEFEFPRLQLYWEKEPECQRVVRDIPQIFRAYLYDNMARESHSLQLDDSVPYGFELVLYPRNYVTLQKHIGRLMSRYDYLFKYVRPDHHGGMHITVDEFVKLKDQHTFYDFFNDKEVVEKLAPLIGRKPNKYCKLVPRTSEEWLETPNNHTVAVNVRENGAMEVRLFATPLDRSTFLDRLHLVHFVNNTIRNYACDVEQTLKRYINQHGSRLEYLTRRGL